MIEKYKYMFALALLIIILILSYLLGRSSKNADETVQTVIKTDTTIIVKQSEPLVIEKTKARLVYKTDTCIETKPFMAVIDTIIKTDTVFASYDFPDNNFNLMVKRKPDSTIVQTITITKETVKDRPWWETPAYVIGGTLAGYVIARAVK